MADENKMTIKKGPYLVCVFPGNKQQPQEIFDGHGLEP
jgi:hypothetical protein